jgi:cystathionine beta-lyase/cystathionine gamma-synthase
MKSSDHSPATRALHAGSRRPRIEGAVATPIFQSSTFEYHGEDYHDIGYLRLSNSPNHRVVAERIAALEGAEAALASASGMAAISGALLTVSSAGDHLLVQDCLYGGTTGLLDHELPRFGVSHSVIDPQDPGSWEALLQPNTRVIYVETLTNPLVQVADLDAVVAFAKKHGLISIIDNTFASPINFRPAEHGFDLVVESCTKYMNGHNDLVAGSVAGPADLIERIRVLQNHLGGFLDAHACYMLERGIKTLAVRVRQQTESAGRLAAFLEQHPAVARVNYPGLDSHEQHERAARLLDGFGGMFSFELEGGMEEAEDFLAALTLPAVAASLGGAESLAVRPAAAVHGALSPEERARSGISDGLIRFSTGLEATEDLLADVEQALSRVAVAAV